MTILQTTIPSAERKAALAKEVHEMMVKTTWRIGVIDDNADVRRGLAAAIAPVTTLKVEVVEIPEGPAHADSASDFVRQELKGLSAIISDLHLKRRGGYSACNGDEIAYWSNRNEKPAILCSFLGPVDERSLRSRGGFLPVRASGKEIKASLLPRMLEQCVMEQFGLYPSWRQPSRTLARVAGRPSDREIDFVIPGWRESISVRLLADELPAEVSKAARPGLHCEVTTNVGARTQQELFFEEWRVLG